MVIKKRERRFPTIDKLFCTDEEDQRKTTQHNTTQHNRFNDQMQLMLKRKELTHTITRKMETKKMKTLRCNLISICLE